MHKGQLPYQHEGGTSNGVRPRVYHFWRSITQITDVSKTNITTYTNIKITPE